MNIKYTPGQIARWEAARRKRAALTKPAPIGFDPSKAEASQRPTIDVSLVHNTLERLCGQMYPHQKAVMDALMDTVTRGFDPSKAEAPWRAASTSQAVEDMYRLVKSLGGSMYPRDLPADWPGDHSTQDRSSTEPPRLQPLDLSGVTLDADGWSSWIAAPEGGWAVCPIPLARAMEWERKSLLGFSYINQPTAAADVWGPDCDRIPAIRIKARPASDTEGLPTGAVVRVWYPPLMIPGAVVHAAWLGNGWSKPSRHTQGGALEVPANPTGWCTLADAVYLPIDVRSGA